MKERDTIKISVRIDKETYNRLCKMCKENESISKLVRDYIDIGLGIKTTSDDIEKISEIIKSQIESVCEQPIERLIKVVIKNIRSSEASKNVLYSLLKEFSQQNTDEIIENAERQAIIYATNRGGR